MPTGRNREDSVLDEIDKLVDWQLSGGDQSDSFHGAGWRDNHPCPWCREGFHLLPITARMQEMRLGSYATDEFGQGIVDPDYDYRTDESAVLCPGSEFHGPRDRTGTWDKQSRERAAQRSGGVGGLRYSAPVSPSMPPGRRRRLRFIGPFEPWTIALEDERVIEDVFPGIPGAPGIVDRSRPPTPMVREQRLTATFELNAPIRNASQEWIVQNQADIEDMVFTAEGSIVHMKPLVMPFDEFTVYAENRNAQFPDWVEFSTTYPIEQHPWFMHFWIMSGTADDPILTPAHPLPNPPELRPHRCCDRCSEEGHCACGGTNHPLASVMNHQCCEECSPGVYHHLDHIAACRMDPYSFPPPPGMGYGPRGHETDYVIIDESYEHDDEEIRTYIDAIQATTLRLAQETQLPSGLVPGRSATQAYSQEERGQAVFRSGEETEEGWTRQVAARAQARQVQGAPGPADPPGEEEAVQAGTEGEG